MGDSRRFHLFAQYLSQRISTSTRIADVAAGKGYLSLALKELGFKNVVSFEPYPRDYRVRKLNLKVKKFLPTDAKEFDVIIGMHPDEATDVILQSCATHRLRGIVVPCCIKPCLWMYNDVYKYRCWENHLKLQSIKRKMKVDFSILPMNGRNRILEVSPQ